MDSFDVAVLVVASAEEIYGRIKRDERQRALFEDQTDELTVLSRYLKATEDHFNFCVRNYELSGLKLDHPDGGTELAAQKFLEYDARSRLA